MKINYRNTLYLEKILLIIIYVIIVIFTCFTQHYFESPRKRKFEKGVALCSIIKSENLYIKEFTEYYKQLGVKTIFLYDNNDDNKDEKYSNILHSYLKCGFVKIINVRGMKGFQLKAYDDCITKNKNKYDWLFFFDADEYLYIKSNQTLQSFLLEPRYKHCQTIKINWLCYGDSGFLYYKNNSLQKRFTKISKAKDCNNMVKTIINVKNNVNIRWGRYSSHFPDINVEYACDTLGNKIYYRERTVIPPIHKYAYLKHYLTKSAEEYSNKVLRGDATVTLIKNLPNYHEKKVKKFFYMNKFTKEKLDILKKKLNISTDYFTSLYSKQKKE